MAKAQRLQDMVDVFNDVLKRATGQQNLIIDLFNIHTTIHHHSRVAKIPDDRSYGPLSVSSKGALPQAEIVLMKQKINSAIETAGLVIGEVDITAEELPADEMVESIMKQFLAGSLQEDDFFAIFCKVILREAEIGYLELTDRIQPE